MHRLHKISYVCGLEYKVKWLFKNETSRGAWVAQSVELLTLDFSSGYDPRVMGSSSTSGSTLTVEPAFKILSLSLCPSPLLPHFLSKIKSNKQTKERVSKRIYVGLAPMVPFGEAKCVAKEQINGKYTFAWCVICVFCNFVP